MADEIQQKNNKLEELTVEVEDAQDMIGPLQLIKQSLKDSLEEAQVSLEAAREEVQVKTAQLKQYKKQVDALQEMVGCSLVYGLLCGIVLMYSATLFFRHLQNYTFVIDHCIR